MLFRPQGMLLHIFCSLFWKLKVTVPECCEWLCLVPLLTTEEPVSWLREDLSSGSASKRKISVNVEPTSELSPLISEGPGAFIT